nr:MAG TPA: hypothetical protein [Ackermannviridae sp.]
MILQCILISDVIILNVNVLRLALYIVIPFPFFSTHIIYKQKYE